MKKQMVISLLVLTVVTLSGANLKSKSGKIYEDYKIEKATPKKLTISFKYGMATLYWDDLPDDLPPDIEAEREKIEKKTREKEIFKQNQLRAKRLKTAHECYSSMKKLPKGIYQSEAAQKIPILAKQFVKQYESCKNDDERLAVFQSFYEKLCKIPIEYAKKEKTSGKLIPIAGFRNENYYRALFFRFQERNSDDFITICVAAEDKPRHYVVKTKDREKRMTEKEELVAVRRWTDNFIHVLKDIKNRIEKDGNTKTWLVPCSSPNDIGIKNGCQFTYGKDIDLIYCQFIETKGFEPYNITDKKGNIIKKSTVFFDPEKEREPEIILLDKINFILLVYHTQKAFEELGFI